MVLTNTFNGSLRQEEFRVVKLVEELQPAKLGEIFRVHDYNYLMKVIETAKAVEEHFGDGKIVRFDRDTVLSAQTWKASLLSAGAAIKGIDMIMKGDVDRAFCAARPPGHHAGVWGKTL